MSPSSKLKMENAPPILMIDCDSARDQAAFYRIGIKGVTRIELYHENGQHAAVPWFAVFKGDSRVASVNASLVQTVEHVETGGTT